MTFVPIFTPQGLQKFWHKYKDSSIMMIGKGIQDYKPYNKSIANILRLSTK